ncbi:hypothetical protein NL676_023712 [Syzygium grande]|nr:hypothetical protein NL676_023712 [Syzygium grande]
MKKSKDQEDNPAKANKSQRVDRSLSAVQRPFLRRRTTAALPRNSELRSTSIARYFRVFFSIVNWAPLR